MVLRTVRISLMRVQGVSGTSAPTNNNASTVSTLLMERLVILTTLHVVYFRLMSFISAISLDYFFFFFSILGIIMASAGTFLAAISLWLLKMSLFKCSKAHQLLTSYSVLQGFRLIFNGAGAPYSTSWKHEHTIPAHHLDHNVFMLYVAFSLHHLGQNCYSDLCRDQQTFPILNWLALLGFSCMKLGSQSVLLAAVELVWLVWHWQQWLDKFGHVCRINLYSQWAKMTPHVGYVVPSNGAFCIGLNC